MFEVDSTEQDEECLYFRRFVKFDDKSSWEDFVSAQMSLAGRTNLKRWNGLNAESLLILKVEVTPHDEGIGFKVVSQMKVYRHCVNAVQWSDGEYYRVLDSKGQTIYEAIDFNRYDFGDLVEDA